jgi:hypothetical protein
MAIKVKEMKDDALVEVKVNKSYYQMVKAMSFYLFNQIQADDKSAYLKEMLTKEYTDMDDLQRSFYTLTLLLAEIEQQVKEQNLFEEKEVLQPGDEGYVAPTITN